MKQYMKCRIITGGRVADVVPCLNDYQSIYIVADRNVAHLAEKVAEALSYKSAECMQDTSCASAAHRLRGGVFYIDATEENKSMPIVLDICRWLMDNGADRNALVLAIGGGITTDMAGFAAAIYKRGVHAVYIPTTFLSQVDAAIGGKTGVNFENYKNILGVIRQPEFTYVCPEALGSLPYRDFLSGAAELLKTFIIDNSDGNYGKAVSVLSRIHENPDSSRAIAEHSAELEALIGAAAKIKAGVVERDEFEQGERRKLNLGHTFAHAIEWECRSMQKFQADAPGRSSSFPGGISHGEAVSMGIIMAAKVSERYYGERKSLVGKLAADFRSCGLLTVCPFPPASLSGAMQKDKKAENGIVHFVLIHDIGDVRVEDLAVRDAIRMLSE